MLPTFEIIALFASIIEAWQRFFKNSILDSGCFGIIQTMLIL
jgi:hypothetical protein